MTRRARILMLGSPTALVITAGVMIALELAGLAHRHLAIGPATAESASE